MTQPAGPGLTRIRHFEIRRLLGAGTFGAVYLAFDTTLQREVAVKVPKADDLTPEEKAEFLKEARAAADIHHANVCPVFEANTHEGTPYIVMRFVPGTLDNLLKRFRGTLPPKSAVVIARKLASGLAAAHARGIIHRDLKPANVLFDEASRDVLIADFGLARLVDRAAAGGSTGAGKGTPLYMPPEQWSSKHWGPIGEHSDVYALGVILYEMLAGRTPFVGSPMEVMFQHCQEQPKPPSHYRAGVDPALDAICLKALAKMPADRYPSARALADALGAYANPGEQKDRPPGVQKDTTTEIVLVDANALPKATGAAASKSSKAATGSRSKFEELPIPPDHERNTMPGAAERTEPGFLPSGPFNEAGEPEPPRASRSARPKRVPEHLRRPPPKGGLPWLWLAVAFVALMVFGLLLALFLDRRLSRPKPANTEGGHFRRADSPAPREYAASPAESR